MLFVNGGKLWTNFSPCGFCEVYNQTTKLTASQIASITHKSTGAILVAAEPAWVDWMPGGVDWLPGVVVGSSGLQDIIETEGGKIKHIKT